MKTKTKPVYYCDFCKKHSLRRDSMVLHEKHCTMNPKRECRLCGNKDLSPLIAKYKDRNRGQVRIKDIVDDVDGCPNCALTIIRVCELTFLEFDYKEELKQWWERKNADNTVY